MSPLSMTIFIFRRTIPSTPYKRLCLSNVCYTTYNAKVFKGLRKLRAEQLLFSPYEHQTVHLPVPSFSFALSNLLFLRSPSMTSVKRTSFPASSPSTRTRMRVSRKQAMWSVSTERSTPVNKHWAGVGQQVIRTEVGTAPLDTAGTGAHFSWRTLGACCVWWLDWALECLS